MVHTPFWGTHALLPLSNEVLARFVVARGLKCSTDTALAGEYLHASLVIVIRACVDPGAAHEQTLRHATLREHTSAVRRDDSAFDIFAHEL